MPLICEARVDDRDRRGFGVADGAVGGLFAGELSRGSFEDPAGRFVGGGAGSAVRRFRRGVAESSGGGGQGEKAAGSVTWRRMIRRDLMKETRSGSVFRLVATWVAVLLATAGTPGCLARPSAADGSGRSVPGRRGHGEERRHLDPAVDADRLDRVRIRNGQARVSVGQRGDGLVLAVGRPQLVRQRLVQEPAVIGARSPPRDAAVPWRMRCSRRASRQASHPQWPNGSPEPPRR